LEAMMKNNKDIKEKIIVSAKKHLKQQGSFTIKELADDCFINIAAVNYHFGSKENLLNLVLQEIIDELKGLVTKTIDQLPKSAADETTMELILDLIYTYAIENVGIINYLFLQNEYQGENAHILIREFFSESDFTREIYKKIAEATQTHDDETLKVKYLLLFSSFAIPLFIQILAHKNQDDILTLKSPTFRKKYIDELIKILYNH
jgi:AcrR family transcriptional regulator